MMKQDKFYFDLKTFTFLGVTYFVCLLDIILQSVLFSHSHPELITKHRDLSFRIQIVFSIASQPFG